MRSSSNVCENTNAFSFVNSMFINRKDRKQTGSNKSLFLYLTGKVEVARNKIGSKMEVKTASTMKTIDNESSRGKHYSFTQWKSVTRPLCLRGTHVPRLALRSTLRAFFQTNNYGLGRNWVHLIWEKEGKSKIILDSFVQLWKKAYICWIIVKG